MPRRPLVGANWKLNPTSEQAAIDLARGVTGACGTGDRRVQVAVFPPTVWLRSVARQLQGGVIEVGAQDSYWEPSGAFTGATSVAMLAGWCQWTLVGHSERRKYFGMTDDDVARAAAAAVATGLRTLICVGEQEDDYRAGRTEQVVAGQVEAALSRLGERTAEIAFAYEPVWAIGTGRTPVPAEVEDELALIREQAGRILGGDSASSLRVLYGGSVKPDNIASFIALPDCDGALVGGASLDADEFAALVRTVGEEVPR